MRLNFTTFFMGLIFIFGDSSNAISQNVLRSQLYILEKRGDELYLKIGSANTTENKFKEYHIQKATIDLKDNHLLSWSYFLDKNMISLGGACLVDIDILSSGANNFVKCLPRSYPNRTFARIPKTKGVVVFDSTDIELTWGSNPYYLNLFNYELSKPLAHIKIDQNRVSLLNLNSDLEQLPTYLAFNQFIPNEKSIDFMLCKIKLIDVKNSSSIDIDAIDISKKSDKDTTSNYFSYSLEWTNKTELTYLTGKTFDGLFRNILVWKFIVGASKPELIYSFNVDVDWRSTNNTWTDKHKVHVYEKNFLFVDDHQIYLNPKNGSVELYRTKNKNDIIIDAIIVD